MVYMTTIIIVHREYSWSEWRNYDTLFCKLAALRRDTKWSVIKLTIYARCFTAATRKPPRCELCLAFSHEIKDCNHQDFAESSIEGQLKGMEQSIQTFVPAHAHLQLSRPVKCVGNGIGETAITLTAGTHTCVAHVRTSPDNPMPQMWSQGPNRNPSLWDRDRAVQTIKNYSAIYE